MNVISVDREAKLVTVEHMPQSQRELIDELCIFWTIKEMPFPITEVLRYERPQRVFYAVKWLDGEIE